MPAIALSVYRFDLGTDSRQPQRLFALEGEVLTFSSLNPSLSVSVGSTAPVLGRVAPVLLLPRLP